MDVVVETDLPLERDGSLYFYWHDAAEEKQINPGVVFMFGKVYCFGAIISAILKCLTFSS